MNKQAKKGFTIIEVVLVLAIAGLIFLMVFIALPALQRSQRNTRRRQDMARILSALTDYQANNNGQMPCQTPFNGNECYKQDSQLTNFIERYVVGEKPKTSLNGYTAVALDENGNCYESFCDPDGSTYAMTAFTWNEGGKTDEKGNTYFEWVQNDPKKYYETAQNRKEIMLALSAKCDEENEGRILRTKGKSEVAIMYILEGGAVYCGDNQ